MSDDIFHFSVLQCIPLPEGVAVEKSHAFHGYWVHVWSAADMISDCSVPRRWFTAVLPHEVLCHRDNALLQSAIPGSSSANPFPVVMRIAWASPANLDSTLSTRLSQGKHLCCNPLPETERPFRRVLYCSFSFPFISNPVFSFFPREIHLLTEGKVGRRGLLPLFWLACPLHWNREVSFKKSFRTISGGTHERHWNNRLQLVEHNAIS